MSEQRQKKILQDAINIAKSSKLEAQKIGFIKVKDFCFNHSHVNTNLLCFKSHNIPNLSPCIQKQDTQDGTRNTFTKLLTNTS